MRSPILDVSTRLVAYVLFVTALFACHGQTTSTPPTSAPTKSNASSTTISVDDAVGNRLQDATVTLSTALDGAAPSGTTIGAELTGLTGQAVFNGLPASGQICVSAKDDGYLAAGSCRQPFPAALTIKLDRSAP